MFKKGIDEWCKKQASEQFYQLQIGNPNMLVKKWDAAKDIFWSVVGVVGAVAATVATAGGTFTSPKVPGAVFKVETKPCLIKLRRRLLRW